MHGTGTGQSGVRMVGNWLHLAAPVRSSGTPPRARRSALSQDTEYSPGARTAGGCMPLAGDGSKYQARRCGNAARAPLPAVGDTAHPPTWSPDGRQLAAATGSTTIKVWDVATGKESLVLTGRLAGACVWNPDSRRLASAGGGITVWDTGLGYEDVPLNGHTGEVTWAVWSPDGRHVASASRDRTLRVWDVATAKQARTLDGSTEELLAVAWSGDGSYLASMNWTGVIKVWDTQTWQSVATLTRNAPPPPRSLVTGPQGRRSSPGAADSRHLAAAKRVASRARTTP